MKEIENSKMTTEECFTAVKTIYQPLQRLTDLQRAYSDSFIKNYNAKKERT